MKTKIINGLIWLAIIGIVIFWTWFLEWMSPGTPFQAFFASLLIATPITICIIILLMAICIKIKRGDPLWGKGIDIFAILRSDPEKVKSHMLYIMQRGHEGGIAGAFGEFNDIFRNYPDWKLEDWEVFRAWYKYTIDNLMRHPDSCRMTMKGDGSPYAREKDPLYDPSAPDWEPYIPPTYDDDDEDDEGDYPDDDDYFDDDDRPRRRRSLSQAAASGFALGAGIGVSQGLFGDSGCDGCDGCGGDSCDGGNG